MNSIKCSSCGLVNFAGSTACKRCDSPLSSGQSGASGQPAFVTYPSASNRSAIQTPSVQPSFFSVVKNDYGALLGLAFPVVLWGLFIATNVFGLSLSRRGRQLPTDSNDSTFLYIAIVGTVLGIGLLVWRMYTIKQFFANGEIAIGRITNVAFFKDRGQIEYSYHMNGQPYQSRNAIMKNQKTQAFRNGDEIELIVDRSNPKRAFIKELYT
jgi:hypothetical protein